VTNLVRRVLLVSAAAHAGSLAIPGAATAHAVDASYQLPVPLSMYLAGAAGAVMASVVVTAVVAAPARDRPSYPLIPVPHALAAAGAWLLRAIGLVAWLGIIASGLLGIGNLSLPAVGFWVLVWVGVPVVAVLLGNPWPSLSPIRSLHAGVHWVAAWLGRRADLGFAYPRPLARWPAVALLFAALFLELALPGTQQARTVAVLLIGYTLLALAGMTVFGRAAWLRNSELFEVLFGWFGRIGPVARRSVDGTLCGGCADECDPERCIDCSGCSAAEERHERRPLLRPWLVGLADAGRGDWSDVAFILLALAGVSYDGLSETAAWAGVGSALFNAALPIIGPLHAFTAAGTIGLAATWLTFASVFMLATALARLLLGSRQPLRDIAVRYAVTLLPIAAAYVVAHYFTLLIQAVAWLPQLVADARSIPPTLGWLPPAVIWYASVLAIVGGHVVAVTMAHRLARAERRRGAAVAGLPLVVAMVGYTVLSLWIIAQPIVIEPA
jgi:hypothetical protein